MSVVEYQKKTNRIYSEFGCHCHSIYEIYYFVSGNAEIMIEGRIYKLTPHSVVLLAPGVMHGIQVNSNADYVRDVIYIKTKDLIPERLYLLKDIFPDIKKNPNEAPIYDHVENYRLDQFFQNIYQIKLQSDEIANMYESIFVEALISQLNLLSRSLNPIAAKYRNDERVTEIANYINLHLTDNLSLGSISEHFFISKNYLNKLFKQHLGTTVVEYIRYKRVIIARGYIIQDGESATNAALRVGFTDYSSFYRTYLKYIKNPPSSDM